MNATDELLGRIHVVQGDITQMQVDAIVNAANQGLIGGGGVDGAIHRAAGPELLVACRAVALCRTGQARITRCFRLRARYVIHTAGPVYRDGQQGEPELLESCYNSSLRLAQKKNRACCIFLYLNWNLRISPRASLLDRDRCHSFLVGSA